MERWVLQFGIWTDRLTITISKLLQLPNAVGKSFHASSDHWPQLLLAPSTEAVFESHHPVRLLSRSSAFRKRSNLMNSRIRLVFMSLTLLTSQCPLVRTYCSTLEFSWRSPKDWPRPCCCSPLPTPASWCQLWPRGRPPTPRRCCPTSSSSSALRTSVSSPPLWEPTWSSCLQPRTACRQRGLDVQYFQFRIWDLGPSLSSWCTSNQNKTASGPSKSRTLCTVQDLGSGYLCPVLFYLLS